MKWDIFLISTIIKKIIGNVNAQLANNILCPIILTLW